MRNEWDGSTGMNRFFRLFIIFVMLFCSCITGNRKNSQTFESCFFKVKANLSSDNEPHFRFINKQNFDMYPYLFSFEFEDTASFSNIYFSFQKRGNTDQDEFLSSNKKYRIKRVHNNIEEKGSVYKDHQIKKIDNYHIERVLSFYPEANGVLPQREPGYICDIRYIYSYGLFSMIYIIDSQRNSISRESINKLKDISISELVFTEKFYSEIDTLSFIHTFGNSYER